MLTAELDADKKELSALHFGQLFITSMGFAVFRQILSCPLFDYNSCNRNNTEKVVVLKLCVLLWLFIYLVGS